MKFLNVIFFKNLIFKNPPTTIAKFEKSSYFRIVRYSLNREILIFF